VLTTFNRMHRFGNPLKVTPLLMKAGSALHASLPDGYVASHGLTGLGKRLCL